MSTLSPALACPLNYGVNNCDVLLRKTKGALGYDIRSCKRTCLLPLHNRCVSVILIIPINIYKLPSLRKFTKEASKAEKQLSTAASRTAGVWLRELRAAIITFLVFHLHVQFLFAY